MTANGRRRIAYVADTMVDVRMLEGLGRDFDVVLLVPEVLGDATATFWPPRPPARVERVFLPGGRVGFVLRAARWLARSKDVAAVVALDNVTASLAATLGSTAGGPPVIIQAGRPTLEYVRCKRSVEPAWKNFVRRVTAGAVVWFNERRAAGVAAVSDYVAAQSRRRNANVRSIAAYGVDTEFFAPRWTKQEARQRLGLPTDRPVVLWRSRFAPEKDPDTFLRAMKDLARERDVCVAYLGGEYRDMQERARRHGVDVDARPAAGIEDIPLWYVAADVDVQTSHAEGLGMSPLEALACGTPVVVTDVGGLPEVVDGGRCGALVPAHDPVALKSAVVSLLDDPEAAARASAAGRSWVEERYTADAAFDAWARMVSEAARPVRRSTAPRVLFVDHETFTSGGELDMVDLVRGLEPGQAEVHVAVPDEGPIVGMLREAGAHVHVVPLDEGLRRVSRWDLAARPWRAVPHVGRAVRTSLTLARLARRLDVDLVHSHSMKTHLLAVPAARLNRVPHVWHVKDILVEGWLRRAFVFAGGVAAHRIVCISNAVADQFRGTRGEGRVRVVYCGLRPPVAAEPAVAAYRQRFGADDETALVGMVGRTARWKGHDVFVDAAARTLARRDDVRFAVIAGCVFKENEGDFDAAVQQRVVDLGIADRLTWLDDVDDMPATVGSFDLLVHPSRAPEPFGRVIVEAFAQGTPVISTPLGAGPELVPESAGRLVEPGDPDALAAAVEAMLDDRAALAAMRAAARARADDFDISRAAGEMVEVYAELLR